MAQYVLVYSQPGVRVVGPYKDDETAAGVIRKWGFEPTGDDLWRKGEEELRIRPIEAAPIR